ncbi:hypothetical protein E3N88_12430 [Mikania micrantha]|uniref:BED-type domain-containing protein n=1 Tax=Mikania micrantha TaxID=192012 RepID=A0A5N6P5H9_9ASTR|nr:hypothetical protein E3N88_12430 [Mikania micrantha]
MAHSTSSVGQGSNAEVTVVRVLTHSRNMEIWCNWDLVEMNDGSQKARYKYCGMLLAKESNTSLKKHITKPFCKALKNDPESQQTQISNNGGIFHYNVDEVRDRMTKFVIQEALPFGHFDNPRLTNMIRDTLQPRYNHTFGLHHMVYRNCIFASLPIG